MKKKHRVHLHLDRLDTLYAKGIQLRPDIYILRPENSSVCVALLRYAVERKFGMLFSDKEIWDIMKSVEK